MSKLRTESLDDREGKRGCLELVTVVKFSLSIDEIKKTGKSKQRYKKTNKKKRK